MARTKATPPVVPVLPPSLETPPSLDLPAEPVTPPSLDLPAEPVTPPSLDLPTEPVVTEIEGDGPFKVRHKVTGAEHEVSAEYLAVYRETLELI
jgi:hypothetical protein